MLRSLILGGIFLVGFLSMVWTGAQPDALALGLSDHAANIISTVITSAVTVLGTAAAYFHVNTPTWFKAKDKHPEPEDVV